MLRVKVLDGTLGQELEVEDGISWSHEEEE
jgi:hypothetical protein